MAKRVFFSFHYQDVADFRANVVRNHWISKPDRAISGYYDASIWEEAQKKGELQLKRLINTGLEQTSNTCVLIGSQTYLRPWVRYELLKSLKRGNHIFGVHINSIKSKNGTIKAKGPNPLDYVAITYSDSGLTVTMWEWANNQWVKYLKIDGAASYRLIFPVAQSKRGRSFKLSELYKTFDWVQNDGYTNFSSWVK